MFILMEHLLIVLVCKSPTRPLKEITGIESTNPTLNEEEALLEVRKLAEDAIISLLNENLQVPELSGANSNSIYDSQLISSLLAIVDIPRKNIINRLNEITAEKNRKADLEIAEHAKSLDLNLGTDIGVGTIHIIIFALALFSISETSLLGLLSEKQFENIRKDPIFSSLLPSGATKQSTLESVNELSRFIIDAYQLFENDLRNNAI